ncbi:hypothetical protein [Thioalkalivibrio thiocyanodenitrificans]|uniref:hypothetical protein n=1 Tax=Thioalkalivibrio thiocyanodenitrificans TaxID=243063 RepID=UPI0012E9ED83|nr:hypothetical protein [Thioalkalivibrio thiocyanodenitrificans]
MKGLTVRELWLMQEAWLAAKWWNRFEKMEQWLFLHSESDRPCPGDRLMHTEDVPEYELVMKKALLEELNRREEERVENNRPSPKRYIFSEYLNPTIERN